MTPPLPEPPPARSNTFTLSPVNQYGGLLFSQKDVAALGVRVVPTEPPVKWQLKMTGPGSDSGSNLKENEVKNVLLAIGYEWEENGPDRISIFLHHYHHVQQKSIGGKTISV